MLQCIWVQQRVANANLSFVNSPSFCESWSYYPASQYSNHTWLRESLAKHGGIRRIKHGAMSCFWKIQNEGLKQRHAALRPGVDSEKSGNLSLLSPSLWRKFHSHSRILPHLVSNQQIGCDGLDETHVTQLWCAHAHTHTHILWSQICPAKRLQITKELSVSNLAFVFFPPFHNKSARTSWLFRQPSNEWRKQKQLWYSRWVSVLLCHVPIYAF